MAPRAKNKAEKGFVALNEEYDDLCESMDMLRTQHRRVIETYEALVQRREDLKAEIADAGKALYLGNTGLNWVSRFDGRAHHIDFTLRKSFDVKKFVAAGGDPEAHPGIFKKKYTATIKAAETAVAEGVFNPKMSEVVNDCIQVSGASCTFRDGARDEN